MEQSILITGGNGFIGCHLAQFLKKNNHKVVLTSRNISSVSASLCEFPFRSLDLQQSEFDFKGLFNGIDIVIHLAGISQVDQTLQADHQLVNRDGTLKLARHAQREGVKRFIFISTVKVYGESSSVNGKVAFTEKSPFNPLNYYSQSKLEAEKLLKSTCARGDMDYVIFRVPLVYGPGVKANFYNLIKLISYNYPLPFLRVTNIRSFLYVENLCDLIDKTIKTANYRNIECLVKDHDMSTRDLIIKISMGFKIRPRLYHVSPGLIRTCARLLNKATKVDSLYASFLIDDTKIRKDISWKPVISSEIGIERTVEWFKNSYL